MAEKKLTIRKESQEIDFFCPIGYTIDIISKKWTLYIIRGLNGKPKYFNEILNSLNWGLTPKILSSRLKELLKEEIIKKEIIESTPPRVRYSLTKRGEEFVESFRGIEKWSRKWNVLKEK